MEYIESLFEGKGSTLGKERTFLVVCNQTTMIDRVNHNNTLTICDLFVCM